MTTDPIELILYFSLYSIIGWICESIWCSIGTKKLVNRGFLAGPYCPIYGFGALLILFTCVPLMAYPPLVFVVAMLAASVLEYFTGWLLEALFHTKWWDYSKRALNIKGRICLRNALLFGLMGLAATYFAHPLAERLILSIQPVTRRYVALGIVALLAADLAHTLYTLLGMQKRLRETRAFVQELEHFNELYHWLDRRDLKSSFARLKTILTDNPSAESAAILQKLDSIVARGHTSLRLFKAFPGMAHSDLGEELRAMRETWLMDVRPGRKKEDS